MGQTQLSMVPADINQHTPMVLLGRPMVCRACAMLSTRDQQTKTMGGLQKYHGTSLTAHGTCAHCLGMQRM
jgi:hypothetical protein